MEEHQRISAKLTKFVPSLTLSLKSIAGERRSAGLPVYDFGLGETRGELHPRIREAGERAFREARTAYADPAGTPELRRAVVEWLGVSGAFGPEHVTITTGAKQALFNIFLAVCNPSDCILLDAAPWVSYQPLAVAAYAFPVAVLPLVGHGDHLKVSAADLERNLEARPHARLFLLDNPCNPTGQLYSAQEVADLLEVCCRYGVYMVLDRLYWRIMFDGREYPEPTMNERTRRWLIQVDGMSKNFRSTGGMRIGWTVADTDITKAMVNLQSHYTSGPSVPEQAAALAAISAPYDPEMVVDLERKRDLLLASAAGMPHVEIWPTPASFYSFWNVEGCLGRRAPGGETISTADDLSRYLLDEAGVVTASGRAFLQEGFLRLSFTTSDEDITQGMAAAAEALGKLA